MKVLVVDEEFPFPLNTGKRLRTFNLLSRIASAHDLRYLAYGTSGGESFTALQEAGMKPMAVDRVLPPKAGAAFYARLLLNVMATDPYIVTSHFSEQMQQAVREQVASFKPDVVLCEWTPYAVFVKELDGVVKVVSAHNVEAQIWKRYYENETNSLKRWYIGLQHRKVEGFERRMVSWIDAVTTVSDLEAGWFRGLRAGMPVEVIDNGVDLNYFTPQQPAAAADPHSLVFTGSMDWRPNQDAAVFFVQTVLPRLKERIPGITVTLVGRNPPLHIRDLGDVDGVTVTGTVDDVRPYIRDAAAYVVPLRIGGGTRLKILEALAMGKAVISTTVGAEGLQVENGREIVLADGPAEFADSILKVLQDRPLATRLGQQGRDTVVRQYGWDALAQKLETFFLTLIGSRGA